jgi:hypothetical protein
MPSFVLTDGLLLGNGDQIALKSWYMPMKLFEGSGQDLGRWSGHTELIFNLLDCAYVSNSDGNGIPPISRQPHTRAKWSSFARSSLDIRKARLRLEEVAKGLF